MEGHTMLESKAKTSLTLPRLPYEENALEPVISARTLSFHHGKHHAGYVTKLNELIEGSPYAGRPLDEVVTRAAKDPAAKAIFNNAAQAWNHDFYWRSMRPGGGGTPGSTLRDAIERDIGGLAEFRTAFAKAAGGEFGSGWAWLVADKDRKLKIATTDDADTPIVRGDTPLLTIDVWEHAYYLDYQNRRPDYIAAWLDKLINWEFAEKNFSLV
jgi:superoxide dismutase, Fe-Mn family